MEPNEAIASHLKRLSIIFNVQVKSTIPFVKVRLRSFMATGRYLAKFTIMKKINYRILKILNMLVMFSLEPY